MLTSRRHLGNILNAGTRDTLTSEFCPGGRVLARREVDGFYHPGTITEQVQVKEWCGHGATVLLLPRRLHLPVYRPWAAEASGLWSSTIQPALCVPPRPKGSWSVPWTW